MPFFQDIDAICQILFLKKITDVKLRQYNLQTTTLLILIFQRRDRRIS